MAHRTVAETVLLEKRLLFGVTVGQLLGFLLWVVALSTDHWTELPAAPSTGPAGGLVVPEDQGYFLHTSTGIWTTCIHIYYNATPPPHMHERCRFLDLVPQPGASLSSTMMDQRRTVAAFAIISCGVMVLGLLFSAYTFRETRYMYKRLAACCHAIATSCTIIVLEVSSRLLEGERSQRSSGGGAGPEAYRGYSCVLAWGTFASQAFATLAFAFCSRKRKKDKAPNEQFAIEEEPTIIGR